MLTMLFIFSLGLFPDNGNTIYRVICAPVISGSNHLPIGPDGRAPPPTFRVGQVWVRLQTGVGGGVLVNKEKYKRRQYSITPGVVNCSYSICTRTVLYLYPFQKAELARKSMCAEGATMLLQLADALRTKVTQLEALRLSNDLLVERIRLRESHQCTRGTATSQEVSEPVGMTTVPHF